MSKNKPKKSKLLPKEKILEIIFNYDDVDIFEHSKSSICNAGANTNLARAFPSSVDGLKVVERRVLYNLFKESYGKTYTTLARIVGDVLGRYHPHGDTAVASVCTRLANDWEVPYPLIDGSGNFGTIYGDSAAHMRYIKAKISKFAEDCYFSEWSSNIVDYKDNFDNTTVEPEYLPCKYPMILINGALGIGYSISTSIPCFNFKEVCESAIKLINDTNSKIKLIPDSPRPCELIIGNDKNGKSYVESINSLGVGGYRMRIPVTLSEEGKNTIIKIENIPFKRNVYDTIEKLKELVKAKKIIGIKTFDNQSRDGFIDIDIIVREGFDSNDIVNKLYSFGVIQDTYGVDMKTVKGLKTVLKSPKDLILEWISNRRITKRRYYNYQLSRKMKRHHELETLIYIIENSDAEKLLNIFRNSTESEIIEKLINSYNITDLQAEAIAGLRLQAFSKSKLEKYKLEHEDLEVEIDYIKDLLRHKDKIDVIIVSELEEGIKKWAKPRNAKLISLDGDEHISDMICHIVLTKENMIKKLPENVKGTGKFKKNDIPTDLFILNNRDNFHVFTDTGRMIKVVTNNIPLTEPSMNGYRLDQYIKLDGNIIANIPDSLLQHYKEKDKNKLKDLYITTVTSQGLIKRTLLDNIIDCNSGLYIVKLNTDDKLVSVKLGTEDSYVFAYTKFGKYLKFPISDVPITGRVSKGVKITDLEPNDIVVGFTLIDAPSSKVIVTKNGYLKRVSDDNITCSKRADKPFALIKLEESDEIISVMTYDNIDDNLRIFAKSGIVDIKIADIPEGSRLSRGKKMLSSRDNILHVKIKSNLE